MSQRHKYLTLAPLFLVLVIDTMGAGIIFPILAPLFSNNPDSILSLSTSDAMRTLWYGITLFSWAALMFIGAPFLGDLSDKMGRKKVLMLSLAGTGIGFAVSALGIGYKSIALLIVGRLTAGFFAGSQPIAQAVIADISDKKDKLLNMSLIIFANCLGFVFGPIVGGYFADPDIVPWFSYSTPFYIAGILALINASLLLVTLRESYQPKINVQLNILRGLTVFVSAFTNTKIRRHSLVLFLLELAWTLFFLYIPVYLVHLYDYDNLNIAHYMSYMGIMFALSLSVGIRIFMRFFALETMVIFSLILMSIALVLIQHTQGYGIWWLSIPVIIGGSIGYSVMITICSNLVSANEQGWVMGVTSSIVAAAFGCGALLAGTLGSLHVYLPFWVASGLGLLSAGLLKRIGHVAPEDHTKTLENQNA